MSDKPSKNTPDPISAFPPQQQGHETLDSLFQEWREDYAARKQEDMTGKAFEFFAAVDAELGPKEAAVENEPPAREAEHGIEM